MRQRLQGKLVGLPTAWFYCCTVKRIIKFLFHGTRKRRCIWSTLKRQSHNPLKPPTRSKVRKEAFSPPRLKLAERRDSGQHRAHDSNFSTALTKIAFESCINPKWAKQSLGWTTRLSCVKWSWCCPVLPCPLESSGIRVETLTNIMS